VLLLGKVKEAINRSFQLTIDINIGLSSIFKPVARDRNTCTIKRKADFIPLGSTDTGLILNFPFSPLIEIAVAIPFSFS